MRNGILQFSEHVLEIQACSSPSDLLRDFLFLYKVELKLHLRRTPKTSFSRGIFFKCRYLDICVVFICSNSRSYHRDQISKIQNIEEIVHLSISVLNQSRFSDHQHSKQIKSEISGLLVSCNINTQSIGVSTVYL